MTEAEIYIALRKYYREKNPEDPECKQTFMIIAVSEDKDNLRIAASLVDPDIPNDIQGLPINLSMSQQTLVYFRSQIGDAIEGPKEAAMAIHQACETLGKEKLQEIVDNSSTSEEFGNAIIQAMEEIEKHGTGIKVQFRA